MECPMCKGKAEIDLTPEINALYPFEICCFECGWFDTQRYSTEEAAEISMQYQKAGA